jgi:hypothetical protein
MIGLIVLGLGAAWLLLCVKLARRIAALCNSKSAAVLVGATAFTTLALLPFLDEIIGRWQFRELCRTEAVVWVSSSASKVSAARNIGGFSERKGFLFPIKEQAITYVDASTGEAFYTIKAFHTPGGFLMRQGLGLGNSSACWPPRWTSGEVGIDIEKLLKQPPEPTSRDIRLEIEQLRKLGSQ